MKFPILMQSAKLFVILIFLFSSSTVFSQTNSSNTTGTPIAASPTYTINGGTLAGGTGGSSNLTLTPVNGTTGGSVTISAGSGYYGQNQGGNITLNAGSGASSSPGKIILNTPGTSSITLGQINVSSAGVMSNISNLTATGTITANSFVGNGPWQAGAAGWILNGANTYCNGNVGIGTSSPAYKLDVNGAARVSGNIYVPLGNRITIGTTANEDNPRLSLHHNGTHGYIDYMDNLYFRANKGDISALILQGDGNVGVGFTTTYDPGSRITDGYKFAVNGSVKFQNGTTTNMVVTTDGNVGIGTINLQGYKLAVNGGIICEEVKVITDVPASDFVFEEGYKPATLSEVEEFVKTNKHLPGIPSAEEFKTNGYSVGKMDNMLLKQVEEMMLHLIELEKENKRLSGEILILKNK